MATTVARHIIQAGRDSPSSSAMFVRIEVASRSLNCIRAGRLSL